MNYPNLFILGAPKCGTTTLYDWLNQSPEFFGPKQKEPHHFYSPYGDPLPEKDYLAPYEAMPDTAKYAIDASVWNLFGKGSISTIIKTVPDAKFLICLRNPCQMAPSLHYQKIFTGHEDQPNFELAWRLNDRRAAGSFEKIKGLPANADPAHMAYRHTCLIGEQVQRVLQEVDRNKVHFCFLDDISASPDDVFSEICNFLDISPSVQPVFNVANKAKRWRYPALRGILDTLSAVKRKVWKNGSTGLFSWIHNANRMSVGYEAPPVPLQMEMLDAFKEDIALLSHLTNRDLSHWLDAPKGDHT